MLDKAAECLVPLPVDSPGSNWTCLSVSGEGAGTPLQKVVRSNILIQTSAFRSPGTHGQWCAALGGLTALICRAPLDDVLFCDTDLPQTPFPGPPPDLLLFPGRAERSVPSATWSWSIISSECHTVPDYIPCSFRKWVWSQIHSHKQGFLISLPTATG